MGEADLAAQERELETARTALALRERHLQSAREAMSASRPSGLTAETLKDRDDGFEVNQLNGWLLHRDNVRRAPVLCNKF